MVSMLELVPDQIFAGQFRVVRPLAVGGMGAVYVVEQLATGKNRALKLMLPCAGMVDGARRFVQEARASSLIPSEHVVDVIAAGVEGPEQVPWMAMELLEGITLGEFLDQRGSLAPREAYDLLEQLAHALTAAHDVGIVHRDLKPDNVFLVKGRMAGGSLAGGRRGAPENSFLVKVLDFGLAKIVAQASQKNTAPMGSPLWMAPEQTQEGETISCATDVWAFGLIAFRMLSGICYWQSSNVGLSALLREILLDPLPPASLRVQRGAGADLPPGFDGWFARAVDREPTFRFPHARQAWAGLSELLEPVLDQPVRSSVLGGVGGVGPLPPRSFAPPGGPASGLPPGGLGIPSGLPQSTSPSAISAADPTNCMSAGGFAQGAAAGPTVVVGHGAAGRAPAAAGITGLTAVSEGSPRTAGRSMLLPVLAAGLALALVGVGGAGALVLARKAWAPTVAVETKELPGPTAVSPKLPPSGLASSGLASRPLPAPIHPASSADAAPSASVSATPSASAFLLTGAPSGASDSVSSPPAGKKGSPRGTSPTPGVVPGGAPHAPTPGPANPTPPALPDLL